VLRALLELPPMSAEDFAPDAPAPAWLAPLQSRLDEAGLGRAQYVLRLVPASDSQGGALQIEKRHHGLASVQLLSAAQLLHGELRS
jgi:DNA gyrase subunit B